MLLLELLLVFFPTVVPMLFPMWFVVLVPEVLPTFLLIGSRASSSKSRSSSSIGNEVQELRLVLVLDGDDVVCSEGRGKGG